MQKKGEFLARFGAKLDIPREALPGGFGVMLSGQNELVVHGCKKILSYGEERIELAVAKLRLVIEGEGLLCSAFGGGAVTVVGKIVAIRLEEVGK